MIGAGTEAPGAEREGVLRLPRRLRPGDEVVVVAPAGPPDPARVERGVRLLEELGLRVTVARHVLDRNGFLAGSDADRDRKSTRLNSSHVKISYAVFCLKKKSWYT